MFYYVQVPQMEDQIPSLPVQQGRLKCLRWNLKEYTDENQL